MMLYTLFSWLNTHESRPFPDHQTETRAKFLREQLCAVEKKRALLAEVRVARFENPADGTAINVKSCLLEQHIAFMDFMAFFEHQFTIDEEKSLYVLGLEYLLVTPANVIPKINRSEKIPQLFTELFAHDRALALAFYRQNKMALTAFHDVNLVLSCDRVHHFLMHLAQELAYQEQPLGIHFLFRYFIDNTEQFSAAILWLLRRGISIEQILETNLLQDFMLYNLISLNDPESEIKEFYTLLYRFPEAHLLVEAAGQVRCEDPAFQRFSLTGTLHPQKEMRSVQAQPAFMQFTPSLENFQALHELFGQKFLVSAIEWYNQANHDVWFSALNHALNQSITDAQLLDLINQIAAKNNPHLLQTLASLLDDKTTELLAARHHGSILHLLPYKPALCQQISAMNLMPYLEEISDRHDSIFDIIPQLMAMFNAFRDTNTTVAGVVYETIIDKMLSNQSIWDDISLITQLRKFSEKDRLLAKKQQELEAQFDQSVAQQDFSLPFTVDNYHVIVDVWFSVSQKINLLKNLALLSSACPNDKYCLQTHIAYVVFSHQGSNFKLDEFIQALEIEPFLASDEVTEYERLLIEIMTTIDNESIRHEIIDKLNEKYTKQSLWIHKIYGGETVFKRAIKHGNLGFLNWLETKYHPCNIHIDIAAIQAAKDRQWRVVDYFCISSAYKPQQHAMKSLLILAVKHGELQTVQTLCDFNINHPTQKLVEEAFKHAIANKHVTIIQFFCNLPVNSPSEAVIQKAFKQAIKSANFELIHLFCGLANTAPQQTAIDQAMQLASKSYGEDIVSSLHKSATFNAKELMPASPTPRDETLGASLSAMGLFAGQKPPATAKKALVGSITFGTG